MPVNCNIRDLLLSGCPRILQEANVVCDPLLPIEIEEMRSMSKQSARTDVIEDVTELDEEEEDD